MTSLTTRASQPYLREPSVIDVGDTSTRPATRLRVNAEIASTTVGNADNSLIFFKVASYFLSKSLGLS